MIANIQRVLLPLATFFTLVLIAIPLTPRYISFQDRIDPGNLTEDYNPYASKAVFNNQLINIPDFNPPSVLGDSDKAGDSQKRIEVDLTNQMLYAYDGDTLVYKFLISSGKWDRTPNGTFKVWTKVRSQKMSGGSKELGTYYYLPNVPYILFFYNDKVPKTMGYSLHGTYWHNNFGVPMSHGCINMVTSEVAQIFNWAQVGTPITIYGKYQTQLPSASLNIKSAIRLL